MCSSVDGLLPHFPVATLQLNPGELRGDGRGCIVQFETILEFLFIEYQIVPDYIWFDPLLYRDILGAIIFRNAPLARQVAVGEIVSGTVVSGYATKYRNEPCRLLAHPRLANGMILFAVKRNAALGF